MPMTGAAGGLSGGLWGALGATLQPGAPYVLDAVRFDERLAQATCVVVGEGRIDAQSVMGKIVGEIGSRALAAGVPLHAIVGCDALDSAAAQRIRLVTVTEATTLDEIENAGERLATTLA
jgi:glycerate kinase